ncbi:MAG: flagellar filament capping protein FliD [Burkholderiales bacterium]
MTTISSPGIGSGLDVNSIINQLLAIERQPIVQLQSKASQIQSQISEYGKLQSLTSAFRDAASALTKNETWGQTVGTSSNTTAVGIVVQSGAAVGNYSLQVQSLAAAQSLASGVFASADETPGAGTLHIELGSWGPGQTTFTPNGGAAAVDITIEATDTLAQVRDKINAANAGVTATVLNDGTGARLLMRSTATGTESAFRTSGVAAFGFDPSSGAGAMTQTQAGANAAATIDGIAISSQSNTLTNVVDGITLTLGQVTTEPVALKVVQDNEALKRAVQTFANAYNALTSLIASQIKYDAGTKTAGPLQGDSGAVGIQRQLRALMGSSSGASSAFSQLSNVGLELQSDGSVKVNTDKLDTALANLPELKKLFANNDIAVPGNNGIARQFSTLADAMLSVDGTLTTRTDGLRKRIEMNQSDQDRLEQRVEQTEIRLRAQYTALDTTLGRLSGISSYVTQQMAMLNSTNLYGN